MFDRVEGARPTTYRIDDDDDFRSMILHDEARRDAFVATRLTFFTRAFTPRQRMRVLNVALSSRRLIMNQHVT